MISPGDKALVLFSGGQDSTTCLLWALENYREVCALCVAYGQRHEIELQQASTIANKLDIPIEVIKLPFYNKSESALFNNSEIEYIGKIPNTYVPVRNALFLTMAYGRCVDKNINNIVIGVSQVDYSGYPDCRSGFISSMEQSLNMGYCVDSDRYITFQSPLIYSTKADTFELADNLGKLDFILEHTHTCYEGVRDTRYEWGYGCGKCPACILRKDGYAEFIKEGKWKIK